MLPTWSLAGNLATLDLPGLSARIDLAASAEGIVVEAAGNKGRSTQWSGLHLPSDFSPLPAPTEAYVREHDLIATYEAEPLRPFRLQWQSRLTCEFEANMYRLLLQTVVSVQTHLLDSLPVIELRSHVPTFLSGPSLALDMTPAKTLGQSPMEFSGSFSIPICRPLGEAGVAGYWIAGGHPECSCKTVAKDENGVCQVQHMLFEQPLEKGVILRSRVLSGMFYGPSTEHAANPAKGLDRMALAAAVHRAWRDFLDSPPPLTA